MSPELAVLAFDYDGTLADEGRVGAELMDQLRLLRADGLRLVVVTGRTLSELLQACPEAPQLFDRLVVENGSVLASGDSTLPLAPPVDDRLAAALARRGARVVRGRVLLATLAVNEPLVRELAANLRLDIRLSRNRESLMIQPPSVSKASGLSHALAALGAASAQTMAVGDGENDVEMLQSCGEGVAVGDAVPALKAVADRVLEGPDGRGVLRLLRQLRALNASAASR